MPRVEKAPEEWKRMLSPEQYHVLFEKGTEAPGSGVLLHEKGTGVYRCAACGFELFSSDAKFDSGTGWPSFDRPIASNAIAFAEDDQMGMKRTEVTCPNCGAHLGHVFDDGPTGTKKRYCVNSCSLTFQKNDQEA